MVNRRRREKKTYQSGEPSKRFLKSIGENRVLVSLDVKLMPVEINKVLELDGRYESLPEKSTITVSDIHLNGRGVLNVSEAVKHSRCSRATIYNWIYDGKIKAEKVDGRWVIDKATLIVHLVRTGRIN